MQFSQSFISSSESTINLQKSNSPASHVGETEGGTATEAATAAAEATAATAAATKATAAATAATGGAGGAGRAGATKNYRNR